MTSETERASWVPICYLSLEDLQPGLWWGTETAPCPLPSRSLGARLWWPAGGAVAPDLQASSIAMLGVWSAVWGGSLQLTTFFLTSCGEGPY